MLLLIGSLQNSTVNGGDDMQHSVYHSKNGLIGIIIDGTIMLIKDSRGSMIHRGSTTKAKRFRYMDMTDLVDTFPIKEKGVNHDGFHTHIL